MAYGPFRVESPVSPGTDDDDFRLGTYLPRHAIVFAPTALARVGSENTASTAKSDLRREALESDVGTAPRREGSPAYGSRWL
jgi:hypothetical protein